MDWNVVLQISVPIGLIVSAALTVMVIASLMINKEMWWGDYPPDVKAKWGPMSEPAKRMRNIFAVPFFGVLIAGAVISVVRLDAALAGPPPFLAIFAAIVIEFLIFNLVDAILIDWLILMKLWPGLGYLPGTEGMAGYTDLRLWTVNLIKGFALSPVMGVLVAGVATLVFLVTGV